MGILEPLPKTKQGNQFVAVMADRCTTRTKAVLTSEMNAITVSRIFVECWVTNYGIPFKLLNDNGSQLVPKFFAAVCSTIGGHNITTTKYHT